MSESSASVDIEIGRLSELLPRYLGPGPRYTSYPTAPVWSDAFGRADFEAALGAAARDLSLYVHVPFCRSLCHFCACNRVVTRRPEKAEQYLDAIAQEIDAVSGSVPPGARAMQMHWGGGTPTYLTPMQIHRLFRTIADAFDIHRDAELSIEVDPRATDPAHIEVLRECGFTRLSMGIQDFEARVQSAIHRIQPVSMVRDLVERARASGFRGVGFDLIYGLPFQTVESFRRTLDQVFELQPDRVALYSYAHVTWVAAHQRGFEVADLPAPEQKLAIMLDATRRFLAAGYEHIGMDHFAKPTDDLAAARHKGTLRRNFMGYTTKPQSDLIGLGPSAISEVGGAYAQNDRDLVAYGEQVARDGFATLRGHRLSPDDVARHFIIENLMCLGSVDAASYEAVFGGVFADRYAEELSRLAPMERDGLVSRARDGSVRVSRLGRFLVRNVAMVFDAYLPAQRESAAPVFSATV